LSEKKHVKKAAIKEPKAARKTVTKRANARPKKVPVRKVTRKKTTIEEAPTTLPAKPARRVRKRAARAPAPKEFAVPEPSEAEKTPVQAAKEALQPEALPAPKATVVAEEPAPTPSLAHRAEAKAAPKMVAKAEAITRVPPPTLHLEPKVFMFKAGSVKPRGGRGFSYQELKAAGVPKRLALRLGLRVDPRRVTSHEENVESLKSIRPPRDQLA
jgi:ribosomal protein L13E